MTEKQETKAGAASAPAVRSIVLTGASVTEAGEYRDAGSVLVIGVEVSAARADELLNAGRAIPGAD